ncbi:MAG: biotin--[acetyl-CoA-carboxylase] ligase [Clostridiales bacterium]|jgi:BirA family biotin operon repressor/biotin-[acetyl-CoA-carboxylase] ligase|nr:biotin--[acetyl-CoA-carboxylase] ligase [Clostridiales bacterium]
MLIGNKILRYAEIDSTNAEVKRLAEISAVENGNVVAAALQTAGRGRRGRLWESPLGGLYFSVFLTPPNLPNLAGHIAMLTGASVASVVNELAPGAPCRLKWCNDVVAPGRGGQGWRKLSGLLAESVFFGEELEYIIMGIGININSVSQPNSVSCLELGAGVSPEGLLPLVLRELDKNYALLGTAGFEAVSGKYRELCVNVGKEVRVFIDAQVTEGFCRGITPDGHMLVETAGGLITVHAGTATVRGEDGYS